MIGGLLRPSSGSVVLRGTDMATTPESDLPRVRAQNIGFIFQAFNRLEALTAEDNILLPAALAPGG